MSTYNYSFTGGSTGINPPLILVKGVTYTFNLNTSGQPFWIKSAPTTGTGDAYSTGVTNNGGTSGTLTFTVPDNAPSILYYVSENSSQAVGEIFVVNSTISIIGDPYIQGNVQISGSARVTGSLIVSGSESITGSLNISGSESITGSLNISGSEIITGSLIISGSESITGSLSVSGSLTVSDTITVKTIVAQTITSSIEFVTGSTRHGSLLTDTHQFTGSVLITGSLTVNSSSVILSNQTSSMSVATASYVLQAVSSSFATLAQTAQTASYVLNAVSASRAVSASQADSAITASYVLNAVSSSFSTLAQTANTASFVQTAQTASYVLNAVSASFASTASSVNRLNQNVVISGSLTVTGSTNLTGSVGTTLLSSNADILILTGSLLTSGSIILTGSLITTGSNTLIGNTSLTGSLLITGSTTQAGNNNLFGNTTLSGSIIISGSTTSPVTPTIKIYGDTETNGVIKFIPVVKNIDNTITGSYIYVSGSTNDLYFTQNGNGYANTTRLRWLEGNLYTGLLNGGLITATTGSTTFNVSSGSGIIVTMNASLNNNPFPTIQYVNWNSFTNVPLTYLTSSIQTFVAIDSSGNIFQQNTPYVATQYNTLITIGTVLHQNKSTINASITYPNVAYGYKQRTYDFLKAFGPLKLSGLTINTSSSLGLTVGSGTAFAEGRNYQVDPNNPSYIVDSGTSVSKIFRYYQSGSAFVQDTNGGLGYTVIDPANYNPNSSGSLAAVPGNGSNRQWSIQRVFWYPNSATKGIVVYYGTVAYATDTEAIANISYAPFNEVENTRQNAVYLGALILRNDAVFTNSATYQILPAGLFRNVGGSGGGGTTLTTLLSGLSDVNISGPTDGQPLVYNTTSAKWTNQSTISASISGNAATATSASYAATASSADNFTVRGTLTAQTIVAQTVSSSIVYSSGSNRFGNDITNTQTFTGSVGITGSLGVVGNTTVTGSITSTVGFTGSLSGSASSATTASYAINATGSFVQGGNSFGATATLGTNDAQALNLETNGVTRLSLTAAGTGSYTGNLFNINGFIGGTTNQTLPAGNTFVNQTFNLGGSGSWGIINRDSWNIANDSSTPGGFVLHDTRIFNSNNTNSSYTGYQAIGYNYGTGSMAFSAFRSPFPSGASLTGSYSNYTLYDSGTGPVGFVSSSFSTIIGLSINFSPFATTAYGVNIGGTFSGSTTYGVRSGVNSGSNQWNIYADGTAFNYLNGALFIGSTTNNGYKFDVTGISRFNGNIALTGSITSTGGFTGSLFGTASNASTASYIVTAQTASYVLNAISSSYAATSSFSNNFTATNLSLGSTPINVTTGYGNYISNIGYPVTGSTDSSDFWIRVINIDSIPQRIRLFIDTSYIDNTISKDEFEIVTSGYGFTNHILRKPTTIYNASKVIGILTSNPSNAVQEVWLNIAAVSTSGTVNIYSNISLDSLANMQTSKTLTKPTKAGGGTELTINNTKRQKYTLQLSAGAEFNGEISTTGSLFLTGSSTFTGPVTSTVGFTGSLSGSATSSSYAATASSADNFTVRGTLTAQTINVQTITSSVDFITGSTRNGSLMTNTHQFTGSVLMTGSLNVTSGITGSLLGTAATASYILNAVSASYWSGSIINAATASYVVTAQTASYVLQAVSASYAINATGSFVQGGNSFGTTAVLGTNDSQSLSIETNNTESVFISSNNRYVGVFRNFPFYQSNSPVFEVSGAVRALTYGSNSSGSFQAFGNSSFPVLYTARLDGTFPGTIVSSGWGDFGINNSLLVGYTPNTSSHGVGTVHISSSLSVGKIDNNSTFDILGLGIITGSLIVTNTISGSLFGTASYASQSLSASYWSGSIINAATASYVVTAQTASYVLTSSYANNSNSASYAITASYILNAVSASYASTSSYVLNAVSSSYSTTALTAINWSGSVINAATASYVQNAQSASYILNAVSSSFAATASYVVTAQTASYVLNAISSSFAATASYVLNAVSASRATSASRADLATTASYVLQAVSASYWSGSVINATTASYVLQAVSASYWSGSIINAATASYVLNAVSSSYWSGSITNAATASYVLNAISSSYATTASYAQNSVPPTIAQNSITAGQSLYLNFTGSGVTATVSSNTASIYIPGGGGSSSTGSSYAAFTQATPATTWTFNHNLGYLYPTITVYDANNSQIIPSQVLASSINQLTITFSSARTGYATAVIGSATPAPSTTNIVTTTGANPLVSVATGSYNAVFYNYVAVSASNARAGNIVAVWRNALISFDETTTTDIGNTSGVTFTASLSTANTVLTAGTTSPNWSIKITSTYL